MACKLFKLNWQTHKNSFTFSANVRIEISGISNNNRNEILLSFRLQDFCATILVESLS